MNLTINNPSYHYEAWTGLFLLFIFIIVYVIKMTRYLPPYVTLGDPTAEEMEKLREKAGYVFGPSNQPPYKTPVKPVVFEEEEIKPKIDLSNLGEINIKNEKL